MTCSRSSGQSSWAVSAHGNEVVFTHGVVNYILMGIGVDSAYGNEDVVTHGVVDYILMGIGVDPAYGTRMCSPTGSLTTS